LAVSSGVVTEVLLATGWSSTGSTMTVTTPFDDRPDGSVTLNPMLTAPLALLPGV
jgi:hypothetical protein